MSTAAELPSYPATTDEATEVSRRTWITIACGAGAVGAAAAAVPFVASFTPSERAKAAGAPVEVDISDLRAGEMKTVEWRGKPVWIIRRSPEQLASLAKTENEVADPLSKRNPSDITPMEDTRNQWRSIKKEVLVAVGICSHLGCSPTEKFATGAQPSLPDNWAGGFLCPCHGSTFDMAGRVFKNKPAPDNLEVPPHYYMSDSRILIGETKKA